MTISHKQPSSYINRSIKILLAVFPVCCLAIIMFYSQNGSLRAELAEIRKEVDTLSALNTELKNSLQGLVDNRALTIQVERLGYIKQTRPTYITLFADGSVREAATVSLRN